MAEIHILSEMKTDNEVERDDLGVVLNTGEAYTYGTRYYTKNARYLLQIEIECAEENWGVFQVWEDWHSNLAQEVVLYNGLNEVILERVFVNATISICAVNGDLKIKNVELITKLVELD